MHSGDVALRFSIVFAVAGFITMAAGVYEDRLALGLD